MAMALNVILLGSALVALGMMSYLLFQATSYSSRYHVILCLALLFYSVGYLLEINAANESMVMQALVIENLGIPAIGPFFLLCVMQLCDIKYLKSWMGYAGVAQVALVFLLVFTNGLHNLYYTGYAIEFGQWTHVVLGKGPLYYYNQLVSIGCAAAAYVVLARSYFRWTQSMRSRMRLIIFGTLVTLVANVVNVLGLLNSRLDITVFSFCITLVCFFIGVQRNKLYELAWLGANMAVQSMDDAMVVLDKDFGLVYYNDSAVQVFPNLATFRTNTPVTLLPCWPAELSGELEKGQVAFIQECAGETRHFRCSVTNISVGVAARGHQGFSIVMRDVTETVNLTNQLEALADTDTLTHIYNRRHLMRAIELELANVRRYKTPASLIMFDIDFFKKVNDTYGHSAGDATLVGVAAAVSSQLRTNDIFGRYGGEEFLVLCPGTSTEQALILAERLRENIAQTPVRFEGNEIAVCASFGIADIQPLDEIDTIIGKADQAMYNAKNNGRNQVQLCRQLLANA